MAVLAIRFSLARWRARAIQDSLLVVARTPAAISSIHRDVSSACVIKGGLRVGALASTHDDFRDGIREPPHPRLVVVLNRVETELLRSFTHRLVVQRKRIVRWQCHVQSEQLHRPHARTRAKTPTDRNVRVTARSDKEPAALEPPFAQLRTRVEGALRDVDDGHECVVIQERQG